MITDVLRLIESEAGVNSHRVCEVFGLSRPMAERVLMFLEDEGLITLDRPASHCGESGTCGSKGPAARLNALAVQARARKVSGPEV